MEVKDPAAQTIRGRRALRIHRREQAPAKTVNTKTYNASNFFVMVVLLKQATSRVGMLSQFKNG